MALAISTGMSLAMKKAIGSSLELLSELLLEIPTWLVVH